MSVHELEDLFRAPSRFDPAVLDAARAWAEEIRPELKDPFAPSPAGANGEHLTPLQRLERRVAPLGITASQSLAELAFIAMDLIKEPEKKK